VASGGNCALSTEGRSSALVWMEEAERVCDNEGVGYCPHISPGQLVHYFCMGSGWPMNLGHRSC
jgi:hypothetical protein